MEFTAKPEVLPPRTKRGGKVFDDENLDLLSHILDDFLQIPGTSIRFGLDGIVGLIPGIGDLVGGIASCVIIFAAWMRGVPYVTVARMVANVGIEVVVGSIPVLGDMFDIAWRANRRNYALLAGQPGGAAKAYDPELDISDRAIRSSGRTGTDPDAVSGMADGPDAAIYRHGHPPAVRHIDVGCCGLDAID